MRTLRATPFTAATTFRRGKKNVFEVFLFENSNLLKTLFFSLTSLESSSFFIILSYPSFCCLDSRWKEGLVAKSFVVAAAGLDSFTSPFHAQHLNKWQENDMIWSFDMDVYLFFELTEVAVDTPGGLMVPNIKAWSKSHLNTLRDNGWLKTTEFFGKRRKRNWKNRLFFL